MVATSTSLPTDTGLPKCLPSRSPRSILRTPRLGASRMTPALRSIWPAAPTPIATISAPFGSCASSRADEASSMVRFETKSWPFSAFVRLRTEEITSPLMTSTIEARTLVPPRSIPRAYVFVLDICSLPALSKQWQAQTGINIQVQAMLFTAQKMKKGGAGDHCRVIGTKFDWRIVEANIERIELLLQANAQSDIRGHATGQQHLLDMILLSCHACLHGQHINHGILKAGGQHRHVYPAFLGRDAHAGITAHLSLRSRGLRGCGGLALARSLGQLEHSGLQPAEAEIVGAAQPGARQAIGVAGQCHRLARALQLLLGLARGLLDRGTAGIVQAENAGNFVESLAGCIVPCPAQQFILSVGMHQHQLAVRARDDQAEQRKCGIAGLKLPGIGLGRAGIALLAQPVGIDMRLQVVHPQERQVIGQRERLAHRQTYQQRARQTGTIGRGDGVDILPAAMRLLHRGFDNRQDRRQLLARGHLWYHAAITIVNLDLRGNDIREQIATILDDRRARLIAGAFNTEYEHSY